MVIGGHAILDIKTTFDAVLSKRNVSIEPAMQGTVDAYLAQGQQTADDADPPDEARREAATLVLAHLVCDAAASSNAPGQLDITVNARVWWSVVSRLCPAGFWPFC